MNLNNCLIEASSLGHAKTVCLLLEAGADVHADSNKAIRWAADSRHTEVVQLLKQYGAKI